MNRAVTAKRPSQFLRRLGPAFLPGLWILCAPPLLARDDAAAGVIEGMVKFPGETPPSAMSVNRDEEACPHGIPQNHLIVEQRNRGIKNVLVILSPAEESDPAVPEGSVRKSIQLKNESCVFVPRVQWAQVGSNVFFTIKGPAHHILGSGEGLAAFDVEVEENTGTLRRPLLRPGLYKINCVVHLWERAWIYVSPHPYVAVTGADGRFRIAQIPPGRYQLRAWHEGWTLKGKDADGRLEYQPMEETLRLAVKDGETTSVTFDNLQPTW